MSNGKQDSGRRSTADDRREDDRGIGRRIAREALRSDRLGLELSARDAFRANPADAKA